MGKSKKKEKRERQDGSLLEIKKQMCPWVGFWELQATLQWAGMQQNRQLPEFFFKPLVALIGNYFADRSVALTLLMARKLTFLVRKLVSEKNANRLLTVSDFKKYISLREYRGDPKTRVGCEVAQQSHWCATYGITPSNPMSSKRSTEHWLDFCKQAAIQGNADLLSLGLTAAENTAGPVEPKRLLDFVRGPKRPVKKSKSIIAPFDLSASIIRVLVLFFQRSGATDELEQFLAFSHKALMDPVSSNRRDHLSFTAAIQEVSKSQDENNFSSSSASYAQMIPTFLKSLQQDAKAALAQGYEFLYKNASQITRNQWSELIANCTTLAQYERITGLVPLEFQPVAENLLLPPLQDGLSDQNDKPLIKILSAGRLVLASSLLELCMKESLVTATDVKRMFGKLLLCCVLNPGQASCKLQIGTIPIVNKLIEVDESSVVNSKVFLQLFQRKHAEYYEELIDYFVQETSILSRVQNECGPTTASTRLSVDGGEKMNNAFQHILLQLLSFKSSSLIRKISTLLVKEYRGDVPKLTTGLARAALSKNNSELLDLIQDVLGPERSMMSALGPLVPVITATIAAGSMNSLRWLRDQCEQSKMLQPLDRARIVNCVLQLDDDTVRKTKSFNGTELICKERGILDEALAALSWREDELDPSLSEEIAKNFEQVVLKGNKGLVKEFLTRYRNIIVPENWSQIVANISSLEIGRLVEEHILPPSFSVHDKRKKFVGLVQGLSPLTLFKAPVRLYRTYTLESDPDLFRFFLERGMKLTGADLAVLARESESKLMRFLAALKDHFLKGHEGGERREKISGRQFLEKFCDPNCYCSRWKEFSTIVADVCRCTRYDVDKSIPGKPRASLERVTTTLFASSNPAERSAANELLAWISDALAQNSSAVNGETELPLGRREDLFCALNQLFVNHSLNPDTAKDLATKLGLSGGGWTGRSGISLVEVLQCHCSNDDVDSGPDSRTPVTSALSEALRFSNAKYAVWLLDNDAPVEPINSKGEVSPLLQICRSYSMSFPTLALVKKFFAKGVMTAQPTATNGSSGNVAPHQAFVDLQQLSNHWCLKEDRLNPLACLAANHCVTFRLRKKKFNREYCAIADLMLRMGLGTSDDMVEGKIFAALTLGEGGSRDECEKLLEEMPSADLDSHHCAHKFVKQFGRTAAESGQKPRKWFTKVMSSLISRASPSAGWRTSVLTAAAGGGGGSAPEENLSYREEQWDLSRIVMKYVPEDTPTSKAGGTPLKSHLLDLIQRRISGLELVTARSKRGREEEEEKVADISVPTSTRTYIPPPPPPQRVDSSRTRTFPRIPPELLAALQIPTESSQSDVKEQEITDALQIACFRRSKHGRDDDDDDDDDDDGC